MSYFLNTSRMYLFFFSMQNINSNCLITFLKFFPIIFFWWKIIPSPLYSFIKDLSLVILSGFFPISSWFYATATACCKHLLSFYWLNLLLLFCFLSNQENLHMIQHDFDLFYDIYNTINQYNRRQTHYISSITNYFDKYF